MKRNRCKCGKVISKWDTECDACYEARRNERLAEAKAIAKTGKCPECGRNLVFCRYVLGHVMCEQYGGESHRANPDEPPCDFHCYTR